MSNDPYFKEVKNYIHNNLKITKDEINSIIVNEVTKQVKQLIANEDFITPLISRIVKEKLTVSPIFHNPDFKILSDLDGRIYSEVVHSISSVVKENLVLSLKNTDMIDKTLEESNIINNLLAKEKLDEILDYFYENYKNSKNKIIYVSSITYKELSEKGISINKYFDELKNLILKNIDNPYIVDIDLVNYNESAEKFPVINISLKKRDNYGSKRF